MEITSEKLYEILCSKKESYAKDNRNDGYQFLNRATLDSSSVSEDVIEIEQISHDTFFVYQRIMEHEWQIIRLKL